MTDVNLDDGKLFIQQLSDVNLDDGKLFIQKLSDFVILFTYCPLQLDFTALSLREHT